MQKWHRELLRRLQEAGVMITGFQQRSNSTVIDVSLGGATLRYYTGISPSDGRAADNAFHDILRGLRAKEKQDG